MSTAIFDPAVGAQRHKARRRIVAGRGSPPPRPVAGRVALLAAAAGVVAVIVLGVATETSSELALPGGVTTFVGSMTGLVGMYLALLMVLIVARIPLLERISGQDGLLRWHRLLSPWPLSLIVLHAAFTTVGYAQAAKTGAWHELGTLITSYRDMLAAVVGFVLMVAIGIISIRAIRSRLRRETWWAIHLYMYLALALSFAHVIVLGPAFVGHPVVRTIWSALWAATAGTVIVYRFGLPIARSAYYGLRVADVRREAPGVTSVILQGRHLERLAVSGGQFFAWRFLARGLWWQAHPYSLSALPRPPYLRLTVKQVGDHSAAVARLRRGTRVVVEGPYGAITPHTVAHDKVALIAGGIGITALRCLLEDLPRRISPAVVLRASSRDQLVLRDEVAELVRHRRGQLHELIGSRREVALSPRTLYRLLPDIAERDVYVCGPRGFVEGVTAAVRRLGVNSADIHTEVFAW